MLSGGRGVYVDFTYCAPGNVFECEKQTRNNKKSTYVFSNNTFENNRASIAKNDDYTPIHFQSQKSRFKEVGIGGGLAIYIRADATGNSVTIESNTFLANEAILGGGLLVNFHDSPKNNSVIVKNCLFNKNSASNGGGGIDVGFLFFAKTSMSSPSGNSVMFDDCNMTHNVAKYGGGTKLFSTRSACGGLSNEILFINCQWIHNAARFGSAVEMSPHVCMGCCWDRVLPECRI